MVKDSKDLERILVSGGVADGLGACLSLVRNLYFSRLLLKTIVEEDVLRGRYFRLDEIPAFMLNVSQSASTFDKLLSSLEALASSVVPAQSIFDTEALAVREIRERFQDLESRLDASQRVVRKLYRQNQILSRKLHSTSSSPSAPESDSAPTSNRPSEQGMDEQELEMALLGTGSAFGHPPLSEGDAAGGNPSSPTSSSAMLAENASLKRRVAQLQSEIDVLNSTRLFGAVQSWLDMLGAEGAFASPIRNSLSTSPSKSSSSSMLQQQQQQQLNLVSSKLQELQAAVDATAPKLKELVCELAKERSASESLREQLLSYQRLAKETITKYFSSHDRLLHRLHRTLFASQQIITKPSAFSNALPISVNRDMHPEIAASKVLSELDHRLHEQTERLAQAVSEEALGLGEEFGSRVMSVAQELTPEQRRRFLGLLEEIRSRMETVGLQAEIFKNQEEETRKRKDDTIAHMATERALLRDSLSELKSMLLLSPPP